MIKANTCVRCDWLPLSDPLYVKYHDEEWGVPVHDDRTLFEMLTLEGAQAGLSWITILKRRDSYRLAFDNFDVRKVARYGNEKIEALLLDPGIIRNRLKVISTVNNARLFIEIQERFGSFDKYLWGFVNNKPVENNFMTQKEVPVTTPLSDAISKNLKKHGFKFVGSTIIYAYMQAVGLVNDHRVDCFRYNEVKFYL
jgi:DNA-3-methyladenine glycosylase I